MLERNKTDVVSSPCLILAHPHQDYQTFLTQAFRRLHWNVYLARSGPEARRFARALEAALITGAASGIGRASALAFAAAGASVALVDIDAEGLAETAEAARALGGRAGSNRPSAGPHPRRPERSVGRAAARSSRRGARRLLGLGHHGLRHAPPCLARRPRGAALPGLVERVVAARPAVGARLADGERHCHGGVDLLRARLDRDARRARAFDRRRRQKPTWRDGNPSSLGRTALGTRDSPLGNLPNQLRRQH